MYKSLLETAQQNAVYDIMEELNISEKEAWAFCRDLGDDSTPWSARTDELYARWDPKK